VNSLTEAEVSVGLTYSMKMDHHFWSSSARCVETLPAVSTCPVSVLKSACHGLKAPMKCTILAFLPNLANHSTRGTYGALLWYRATINMGTGRLHIPVQQLLILDVCKNYHLLRRHHQKLFILGLSGGDGYPLWMPYCLITTSQYSITDQCFMCCYSSQPSTYSQRRTHRYRQVEKAGLGNSSVPDWQC